MNMPDHIYQQLLDHHDTNQLIIYILLSKIKSVPTLLQVFSTLESLIDDKASKQVVMKIKQGKETAYSMYIVHGSDKLL